MTVLCNIMNRANVAGKDFRVALQDAENRQTLETLRAQIDQGGDVAAEALMLEYDARWKALACRKISDKAKAEADDRVIADVNTLASVMNWGLKCKKDGMLEWEQGNWAEAHASWRAADEALRKFRAGENDPANKLMYDLHGVVLKNLSQACMKLEMWADALVAAESALKLDAEDHKAWFRKACACEGLGHIDEAEECLNKIDDCTVGRPDRKRIAKDTQARREKLQSVRQRDVEQSRRMVGKALEEGIFSSDREQDAFAQASLRDAGESRQPPKSDVYEFDNATRKRLTKEGAEGLLTDLHDAYQDTTYQMQILKLARDIKRDKAWFLQHIKKVALPLQKPVLDKWGFEPSERGVAEMKKAVTDFTGSGGQPADEAVMAIAHKATMAMYGCMYDILTRPDSDANRAPELPQMEVTLRGGGSKEDPSD